MANLEDLKGKKITYLDGDGIECTGNFYGYYPYNIGKDKMMSNLLVLTRQTESEPGKTAIYGMEWTDGQPLHAQILKVEDIV